MGLCRASLLVAVVAFWVGALASGSDPKQRVHAAKKAADEANKNVTQAEQEHTAAAEAAETSARHLKAAIEANRTEPVATEPVKEGKHLRQERVVKAKAKVKAKGVVTKPINGKEKYVKKVMQEAMSTKALNETRNQLAKSVIAEKEARKGLAKADQQLAKWNNATMHSPLLANATKWEATTDDAVLVLAKKVSDAAESGNLTKVGPELQHLKNAQHAWLNARNGGKLVPAAKENEDAVDALVENVQQMTSKIDQHVGALNKASGHEAKPKPAVIQKEEALKKALVSNEEKIKQRIEEWERANMEFATAKAKLHLMDHDALEAPKSASSDDDKDVAAQSGALVRERMNELQEADEVVAHASATLEHLDEQHAQKKRAQQQVAELKEKSLAQKAIESKHNEETSHWMEEGRKTIDTLVKIAKHKEVVKLAAKEEEKQEEHDEDKRTSDEAKAKKDAAEANERAKGPGTACDTCLEKCKNEVCKTWCNAHWCEGMKGDQTGMVSASELREKLKVAKKEQSDAAADMRAQNETMQERAWVEETGW